jgi:hypothetical protein
MALNRRTSRLDDIVEATERLIHLRALLAQEEAGTVFPG